MNETNAKKYVLTFMSLLALLATIGMGAAYALDPFQIFHEPYFTKDKYIFQHERFKNAGFINRFLPREDCCDTLVIGSSYSQNFLPSDIAQNFSSQGVLQLSLAGPVPKEQALLHEKASASGEIKTVIWDIPGAYAADEIVPVNAQETLSADPGKYFPEYLYDESTMNDYRILPSTSLFTNFIRLLTTGEPYEYTQSWAEQEKGRFGKGKILAQTNRNVSHKTAPEELEAYEFPAIDNVLITTIEKHPEQKFYIFIPPYSRHYYAVMQQDDFERHMALRYQLAKKLEKYPNVKFFAFDHIFKSTGDLDRYRDYQHFDAEMSKQILTLMAAGYGRITSQNIDRTINQLVYAANNYSENFLKKKD